MKDAATARHLEPEAIKKWCPDSGTTLLSQGNSPQVFDLIDW
jgi:hypothetical protein